MQSIKKMKLIWISDLDVKGSGYSNISTPLCKGLAERGHEIKVIGLSYKGEEHTFPFSLIPAMNLHESLSIAQIIYNAWGFDVCIVALDIPLQERILISMKDRPFKYVGIMPIEADPLCFTWATILMQMDKALIISQFGTDEAIKIGIPAEHIQIGIDTQSWRLPTKEERSAIRTSFGLNEDTFIVLTVADNQERKNIGRAMEIFSDFIQDGKDAKYILVTREHNNVGWRLRDLAQELEISQNFIIFERGMGFKELWSIYALADVFLLTSKAEGLGMPILESFATGVPVIGTNCTAIKELLEAGGGFLLDYADCEPPYRDPFGNGHRYFAKREHGVELLERVYNYTRKRTKTFNKLTIGAREYAESRTWDIAINKLDEVLKTLKTDGSSNLDAATE